MNVTGISEIMWIIEVKLHKAHKLLQFKSMVQITSLTYYWPD